jgi:hypothetical protein
MPQGNREDEQDDVEFDVTNLRPPRPRSGVWQRVHLDSRRWRRVAAGISLVLALAVLLSGVPATHETFERVASAFASPTATPNIVTGIHVEPGTLIDAPLPTPLPGVSGVPPLGPAPTSCPQKAAKPQFVGPGYGQAIGGPSAGHLSG